MRLRITCLALSITASCTNPSKSINTPLVDIYSARHIAGDIMEQPSVFTRRPSEEASERAAHRMPELVGVSSFKPSKFKFDRMYTLYEDGKGNAQIRQGTEIIEEGQIGKERSKDAFTLYSKKGYVLSVHKNGFITVNYGPGELDKPVSR